jgi:hypothetical protein
MSSRATEAADEIVTNTERPHVHQHSQTSVSPAPATSSCVYRKWARKPLGLSPVMNGLSPAGDALLW